MDQKHSCKAREPASTPTTTPPTGPSCTATAPLAAGEDTGHSKTDLTKKVLTGKLKCWDCLGNRMRKRKMFY